MKLLRPRKAVVLAAGFGTRMRPLSNAVPKALMPLWGRPMMEHTLELLRSWGVAEVLINAHHLPNDLLHFILGHEQMGLRLQLSYEPEILGTGGALVKAAWFLGDQPFWLINVDAAADLDPAPLLRLYRARRPLAVLWLHPSRGPRTVEMGRGRITSFRSNRSDGSHRTYTFCGLHLLSPRILSYLPAKEAFAGIVPAYEKGMAAGEHVLGVCVKDCFWADIGSPEDYLDAHRETLERHRRGARGGRLVATHGLVRTRTLARSGVKVDGFASVADDAVIQRGAVLNEVVVWSGARIGPRARLCRAIVGTGCDVSVERQGMIMRADQMLSAAERAALEPLGWKPGRMTAETLAARGSARTFIRLRQGVRRVMLVRYSLERRENAFYAGHARFLASLGLPVPEILLHLPASRFLLAQDLGHISLGDICAVAARRRWRQPAGLVQLYRRVLDHVLRLHRRGAAAARRGRIALMPPFSGALYRWEREYFISEYVLGHLHLPKRRADGLRRDLQQVARRLARAEPVLIHRDLQSSNILIHRGRPCFIDFQGMRLGPAVYDLASLLCDPYVELPAGLQVELLDYYARRSAHPARIRELFWWAAAQRLAQALGAYARLGRTPGAARFLDHIPAALRMMARALTHLPALPHLRELIGG